MMHRYTDSTEALADELVAHARWRTRLDPIPLDHARTPAELDAAAGDTITPQGMGAPEALQLFTDVLAPACLSTDFPRYLAFVPAAPTELSVLFDLVVSAYSIYGGSWLEGAGAVWAENQALRWIADLAGLPAHSGGCFVSGGTNGNLSALVAARDAARREGRLAPGVRPALVAAATAHSSVGAAARVMDADVVVAPIGADHRLSGGAVAPLLDKRVFAVVATAGTTNLGVVDDLASVGALCRERGVWFHVDGAYGGAALAAPSARRRFDGIELADSLIVDPHKWLFAPFDACALVYRDPAKALAAHAHHSVYLDVLSEQGEWNPSDYAIHLTRRARGLPLWFSLAAHGTDAYRDAVETTLAVARQGAELIEKAGHVQLVAEPSLSVLVFRRVGWQPDDYDRWSRRMLDAGLAFVVPTEHAGECVLRLCIVNPRTTIDDLALVLDSLR